MVKQGPGGRPVESFLLCPPMEIDARKLGISPIGVTLVERKGVWHVFDWVGKNHYPNVADFVEEARRYGISRRLPSSLNFELLTPASRLVLLHESAIIEQHKKYQAERVEYTQRWMEKPRWCPQHVMEHEQVKRPDTMCAGLWWEDLKDAESVLDPDVPARLVDRLLPSFEYRGAKAPEDVTPRHKLAAFGSFPIHGLDVIRDRNGDTHEKALEKARRAHLEINLEDE